MFYFKALIFTANFIRECTIKVINVHDVSNIYKVPLLLQEQGVLEKIIDRLQLSAIPDTVRDNLSFNMIHWMHLSEL